MIQEIFAPNKNKTVFAVDDDIDILECIQLRLEKNFDVKTFSSPKDLLKTLRAGIIPNAILSDIYMPEMTGLEFLVELKAMKVERPVIIISGAADKKDAMTALNLGAFALLEKPILGMELIRLVSRAVSHGILMEINEELFIKMNELISSMRDCLDSYKKEYPKMAHPNSKFIGEADKVVELLLFRKLQAMALLDGEPTVSEILKIAK
jgi:DNA-binding NtrC family response regulator